MKTLHYFAALCIATAAMTTATAQVSYTRSGNTTYGSNGTSYTQSGNTVYGSDGSTATQSGNTVYTTLGRR